MQESDIRPAHLLSGARDSYKLDLSRYTKYLNEFEVRKCPGCEGISTTKFMMHHDFKFDKCLSCHCVFMNPGPRASHVEQLYEHSEVYKFWAEYMYPESRESRLATLHKSRVNWLLGALEDFVPAKSHYRILEVGAGTGDTLFALKKLDRPDIHAYAVEWNPDMKPSLTENSVEFVGKTIEDIDPNGEKFDVIVLFEVIEHLLDPMNFMKLASRLLNKDGLFLFSTPNAQSLEVQWTKNRTSTIDIEHITLLSPAAVTHLALRNGFNVRKIETNGKLDRELMANNGFNLKIEIDKKVVPAEDLQSYIADAGFSSNMQVILQAQRSII